MTTFFWIIEYIASFIEIFMCCVFCGTFLVKEEFGDAYLENFKKRVGEEVVGVDPQYFRPTEVELLIGDATKARTRLGWEPEYSLAALIEDMMKNDIKLMKKESYLKEGGYKILNYFE